jgi:hypothetical protein
MISLFCVSLVTLSLVGFAVLLDYELTDYKVPHQSRTAARDGAK